ncbi:hypothetical protein BJX70DRAFT_401457 [Aspergillus crustosus]
MDDSIQGAGTGQVAILGLVDLATHTRSHAGAAYLTLDVLQRPNLRVVTGAHAGRTVFENADEIVTATGVESVKDSTISITREVVLAAGTTEHHYCSSYPGSGIASFVALTVADGLLSGDMARDPAVAAATMAAYQKDGSGPLGMLGLVSALMPCLDFPQPEREELLGKLDASLADETPPAHIPDEIQYPQDPSHNPRKAHSAVHPRPHSDSCHTPAHPRKKSSA